MEDKIKELQPKEIDKYFTDKGKRITDEEGWTGEFFLSAKDVLDFIIDLQSSALATKMPNELNDDQQEK